MDYILGNYLLWDYESLMKYLMDDLIKIKIYIPKDKTRQHLFFCPDF